jgi:hypothetical protein
MKAYKIYNWIDNVINFCIVIIFKWDTIYQECGLSHKHNIVFVFGICTKYAQTNLKFSHIMGYANLNPNKLQISNFSHDTSK